jgi:dipeptidyl aminopeptidase/acylaminoacyl peptidase
MRVRRAALLGLLLSAVAVAASGAGSAILIGNDAPSWSPDGRQIAFTSFRNGNGEIYVMAANGSAQRRLTRNDTHDDHAKWSPDGTRIAFASTRDGNYEIYVMNADGSAPRRLTNDPQADYAPTWSPDGQRIAWRTTRDGNGEIYSMRADGTDPRRLTVNAASDESPDWSADGRIAFSSNRGGGTYQIWAMDTDGSNVVRLSDGRQNKSEPSWSPDARRIVYVSDGVLPLGNTEIYVANVDGSSVQRLTNYDGRDDFPAWSPDGSKVLFTRGVTFRAQDVFTADTDGTHLAKLTKTAAQLEITDVLADQPRAGRAWTIVVLVDDARGLPLINATRVCRATLGGKKLALTAGSARDGLARCTWRLPASARGKLLKGAAGLRVGTLRAELPFAVRVR